MEIITYREEYKQQIINLILHIQNDEAGIALSLDEQPDLKNIPEYYQKNGGQFFIAIEGRELIGTIAIMNYGNNNAVLKKFFVRSDFRGKGIGRALYCELLEYARDMGFERIVLDTPPWLRHPTDSMKNPVLKESKSPSFLLNMSTPTGILICIS